VSRLAESALATARTLYLAPVILADPMDPASTPAAHYAPLFDYCGYLDAKIGCPSDICTWCDARKWPGETKGSHDFPYALTLNQ